MEKAIKEKKKSYHLIEQSYQYLWKYSNNTKQKYQMNTIIKKKNIYMLIPKSWKVLHQKILFLQTSQKTFSTIYHRVNEYHSKGKDRWLIIERNILYQEKRYLSTMINNGNNIDSQEVDEWSFCSQRCLFFMQWRKYM